MSAAVAVFIDCATCECARTGTNDQTRGARFVKPSAAPDLATQKATCDGADDCARRSAATAALAVIATIFAAVIIIAVVSITTIVVTVVIIAVIVMAIIIATVIVISVIATAIIIALIIAITCQSWRGGDTGQRRRESCRQDHPEGERCRGRALAIVTSLDDEALRLRFAR